jgi:hypothetical protein
MDRRGGVRGTGCEGYQGARAPASAGLVVANNVSRAVSCLGSQNRDTGASQIRSEHNPSIVEPLAPGINIEALPAEEAN